MPFAVSVRAPNASAAAIVQPEHVAANVKRFVIHSGLQSVYMAGMGRGSIMVAIAAAGAGALPTAAVAGGPADRAALAVELLATLDRAPPARAGARTAARKTLDRLGVRPLDIKQAADVKIDGEQPFRGRVLGPGYQQGWLDAGAETKLEQQFLAGQRATVAVAGAVVGKGAVPLVLTVVEPGEAPICRDAARACRWMPLYTQRYAITLRNTGAARVRYYLVLD